MAWRNNWFVKNVLAEIALIGPFFQEENLSVAAHLAAKCSFMILGGSLTMYMLHEPYHHSPAKLAEDTFYMTVGMSSGKIAFNCGRALLYGFCAQRQNMYTQVINPEAAQEQNVNPTSNAFELRLDV